MYLVIHVVSLRPDFLIITTVLLDDAITCDCCYLHVSITGHSREPQSTLSPVTRVSVATLRKMDDCCSIS